MGHHLVSIYLSIFLFYSILFDLKKNWMNGGRPSCHCLKFEFPTMWKLKTKPVLKSVLSSIFCIIHSQSICLSISLPTYLPTYLTYLPGYLSVYSPPIYLSIYLPTYPWICVYMYIYICIYTHTYIIMYVYALPIPNFWFRMSLAKFGRSNRMRHHEVARFGTRNSSGTGYQGR